MLEMISIKVKLNLIFFQEKRQIMKFVNVEIQENFRIEDLIKQGLELFNQIFLEEKNNYTFNVTCLDNYQLRSSKKSGKPDYDLPGII